MPKTQLITKLLVTLLGIYAVCYLLGCLSLINKTTSSVFSVKAVIDTLLPLTVIVLVFWYMILDNNWLTTKLLSHSEDNEAVNPEQFVKTMRLIMIFAGLMLLPEAVKYLKVLPSFTTSLRALIHVSLGMDRYSHQMPQDPWYWVNAAREITSLLMIIYLICGAPRYVIWQTRKSFDKC